MPPALGTARAIEKPHAVSENEYVNMPRACRILGASWTVIDRMIGLGVLEQIDPGPRRWKNLVYQSIVDHCDGLRKKYVIPDRRPPLSSPRMRYKDEDLLPFPLCNTIRFHDVQRALGFSSISPVLKILNQGLFECYRLHPAGLWRISITSFVAYLEKTRIGLKRGPHAYKITE
jgi:hypothetical protein